jgi:hypothetical protein
VGLERGPLSLVSTIEGLLERKGSGSGLERIAVAEVRGQFENVRRWKPRIRYRTAKVK